MIYAIIELAGRQFKVSGGDVLKVTRQDEPACNVLFYRDDATTKIGTPYLTDVIVELEKLEDKKDEKVVVARFKAKSRYRRKKGHRQPISVLKVKAIVVKGAKEQVPSESPAQPIVETKRRMVKKAATKETALTSKKVVKRTVKKKEELAHGA